MKKKKLKKRIRKLEKKVKDIQHGPEICKIGFDYLYEDENDYDDLGY